ncbi:hypothetical protein, partial [Pseudomonas sp. USTB-Z]|uniref:hypothetical protein n=1 Tax=Pseudomonas sp. USTB-Z TaxID=2794351 RepID=UPI001C835F74
LPLAGCVEDFHPQVTSEATTAKLVALSRNAPCLAHHKENPAEAGFSRLFPCDIRIAPPSWQVVLRRHP